ncbi:MAG: hypothetical protein JSV44_03115 [Candidatus Zixiibacteriota bacterium]|nr:MAG: hypothetical protein JSV44_03115 [candidate division Zixibacteria bacterium]
MKKTTFLAAACMLLVSGSLCGQEAKTRLYPFSFEYNSQRTLLLAYHAPQGYDRFPLSKMSEFQVWLTNLSLRKPGASVHDWQGQILIPADSVAGILDISVSSHNQKDADLPLYLLWMYHRVKGNFDKMSIILSKTDTLMYSRWLEGSYSLRPGGGLIFKPGKKRQHSLRDFYRCLEMAMSQTDSKNLLLNLTPIAEKEVRPGDLFIQFRDDDPDSAGHTAMIFDVCRGKQVNDILLLAAWGADPPQSIYIPLNNPESKHNPWLTVAELQQQLANFGPGRFYRFAR